ncbi:MAG: TRAP transporter large permease subunit, partial [Zestosphaera sp.]
CCWLLVGGGAFSSVFNVTGGKVLVTNALLSLPVARLLVPLTGFLIIFVLGMFVDPGAITILVAPLLDAAIKALGLSPLWWGVIFVALLVTSYITPPVGLGLYYFKGIVGDSVSTTDVYKAVWPFVLLQIVAILVVFIWPDIVLWIT